MGNLFSNPSACKVSEIISCINTPPRETSHSAPVVPPVRQIESILLQGDKNESDSESDVILDRVESGGAEIEDKVNDSFAQQPNAELMGELVSIYMPNDLGESPWGMTINYDAPCRKWRVLKVEPNGPADRLGIRVGWTLVQWNEHPIIPTFDHLKLNKLKEEYECRLTFNTVIVDTWNPIAEGLVPRYTSLELEASPPRPYDTFTQLFIHIIMDVIDRHPKLAIEGYDGVDCDTRSYTGFVYNKRTNHGHLIKLEIQKTNCGRIMLMFRDLNKSNSQNEGAMFIWNLVQDYAIKEKMVKLGLRAVDSDDMFSSCSSGEDISCSFMSTVPSDSENIISSTSDNLTIGANDYILRNLLVDMNNNNNITDRLASVVTLLEHPEYGQSNINHTKKHYLELIRHAKKRVGETPRPPVERNLNKFINLVVGQ